MKVIITVLDKGPTEHIFHENRNYVTGEDVPILIRVEHDDSEVMHSSLVKLAIYDVPLTKPVKDVQLDSKGSATIALNFSGHGIAKIVAIYTDSEKSISSDALFLEIDDKTILQKLTKNRFINDIYHNDEYPDILTDDKNIKPLEITAYIKNSAESPAEDVPVTFRLTTTADIRVYDKYGLKLVRELTGHYHTKTDADGIATIKVIARKMGAMNIEAMHGHTLLADEVYFINSVFLYLAAPNPKDMNEHAEVDIDKEPEHKMLVKLDHNFDFRGSDVELFCNNHWVSGRHFDVDRPLNDREMILDTSQVKLGYNELFYIVKTEPHLLMLSKTLIFKGLVNR
ncbi:Ig-like domain-containing protein [Brucella gallinifaecis]|uniref:Ig-like domain-containing protein n=1 Tax=Brucella gallinifaecis TaxID=215590 RepID=UPI00235EBAA9|nr:Ig-like domain-containing protein [Brucella gallinifaecis]